MKAPIEPAEILPTLAAALGGQVLCCLSYRRAFIDLAALRVRLHISHHYHTPRGKLHAYLSDEAGCHIANAQSANFDPARHVQVIARDIKRRVIIASRAAVVAHYSTRAAGEAQAIFLRQRIAALDEALGREGDTSTSRHPYRYYTNAGFSVRSESDLTGTGYGETFSAEITVHSLNCFLMIARLVAEDQRVHSTMKANG